MQFDLAASDALGGMYANQFKKLSQVARRDPNKYTRNPDKVFGKTLGVLQYTWRDTAKHDRSSNSPGKSTSGHGATSSKFKTMAYKTGSFGVGNES